MRKIPLLLLLLTAYSIVHAQINASLFRFPAVSRTQIVFTYANDLWIVSKDGGRAAHLSTPKGVEVFPKFSPDGKTIAYTADYDGSNSIYTIPSDGGIPNRLTWHGFNERVVDWYPDGKSLLFASGRESGRERFNQFYKIPAGGGYPEKLPLPYAEYGTLSEDGKQIAFTYTSQVGRNWKRYRGGWNGKIQLFNLSTLHNENISGSSDADDELPMWHGNNIFFLSDRGPEKRMNLWQYDISAKTFTQLTKFTDYDTHYPSLGPEDIVFENGGKLYLYNLGSHSYKAVPVQVVTDEIKLRPSLENVSKLMVDFDISPEGKRVVIEARGELFTVPAENGPVIDLTQTSGIAERSPAWSPNGRYIAYWSDRSGEYELTLKEIGKDNTEKKLTSYGPGFRYHLFWSPDSKKLAFIDKAMQIKIYDLTTGETINVDHALRWMHGSLSNFSPSWSPDSRWLAYERDFENDNRGIFLYDYSARTTHPITSGFYSCSNPAFDPSGKYLFVTTRQFFNPLYSDLDNTFIYPNATGLAAIVLKKTTPSPLYPQNDTVTVKQEDNESASTTAQKDKPPVVKPEEKKKPAVAPTGIDLDGLESRMVLLPVDAGNYTSLSAVEGKLIFVQYPNTGSSTKTRNIQYYDLEKRKVKTILEDGGGYALAADGKHMLVVKDDGVYIIGTDEGQKLGKKLRTNELQMTVDPMQEWKQILVDAWRLDRDYFYDPGMHGVDWNKIKERYLAILEGATSREELSYIIGDMIGELNSSHTYYSGGALEEIKRVTVGYLGINWAAEGDHYKVKEIIRPAAWDAEVRSPLDQPGVNVKEGDFILAVNGIEITTKTEPYAAFNNLGGKPVELTVNSSDSWNGARKIVVNTLTDESRLRHLAWIEHNRHQVEEATGGSVGYIYVRSTGIDGQSELIRQFTAQVDKKALIIDERFNSGGQLPDRFIEMLDRKPLAYFAIRDGKSMATPSTAVFGPKVMLINGWSGSGGDAFPDYFRKAGLGPLIGTRTWGGLIGLTGVPGLIDGGAITVPTIRMYNIDGSWFKEGHGVDPDIPVAEDLTAGAKGVDNQLERAITEIKELLKTKGFTPPAKPAYEVR